MEVKTEPSCVRFFLAALRPDCSLTGYVTFQKLINVLMAQRSDEKGALRLDCSKSGSVTFQKLINVLMAQRSDEKGALRPDCSKSGSATFQKLINVLIAQRSDEKGALRPDCSKSGSATFQKLINVLIAQRSDEKATAIETIKNALQDGLLKPVTSTQFNTNFSQVNLPENYLLRLPKLREIPERSHDPYCFECHLSGPLECCRQCSRSFHRFCYRKNVDEPNYEVPSIKDQENPPAIFDLNSASGCDVNNERNSPSQVAKTNENKNSLQLEDSLSSNHTATTTSYKPSVVYIAEICKNEEKEDPNCELCTCCRLLKKAPKQQPIDLQRDELCHILSFILNHNHTWLSSDLPGYFQTVQMPRRVAAVALKLLCKTSKGSFDDIRAKIKEQSYQFAAEFLVDILDLQHIIGVFFGVADTKFEETKYLVRDICFDLGELKRCPDCVRHSYERDGDCWFTKPCVQRHELAYAKFEQSPYWPVKVLQLLPTGMYDVRFFGGSYSRASIAAEQLKPIDTNPQTLKFGNKRDIQKALWLMQCLQTLSAYPPELFSFRGDKAAANKAMQDAVAKVKPPKMQPQKRRMTRNTPEDDESDVEMESAQDSDATESVITDEEQPGTSVNTGVDPFEEIDGHIKAWSDHAEFLENAKEKVKLDVLKLNQKIEELEREGEVLKTKQWCFRCENEATLLCCFAASYCSHECQSADWEDGHKDSCYNRDEPMVEG